MVEHLLAGCRPRRPVGPLSGGERRRTALVALMLGGHDLLVLDEPTNHLDVEAVAWLAEHLRAAAGPRHGRCWWSATTGGSWTRSAPGSGRCTTASSTRTTAATPRTCWPGPSGPGRPPGSRPGGRTCCARSWPGCAAAPPARTSKPKFRIDAANTLIADEPPPRDRLALQQFSVTRLGKDVFDLSDVDRRLPATARLLDDLSLVDRTGRADRSDRRQRRRQDDAAAAADRRPGAGLRTGQARPDARHRPPVSQTIERAAGRRAGAGAWSARAPGHPARLGQGGDRHAACWRTSGSPASG